jgi:hypothetical protein
MSNVREPTAAAVSWSWQTTSFVKLSIAHPCACATIALRVLGDRSIAVLFWQLHAASLLQSDSKSSSTACRKTSPDVLPALASTTASLSEPSQVLSSLPPTSQHNSNFYSRFPVQHLLRPLVCLTNIFTQTIAIVPVYNSCSRPAATTALHYASP